MGTGLLTSELVAWKGQKFQALRTVLIIEFGELDIVCFRQTSFGGDVDNAKDIAFEIFHLDFIAIHITIYEVEE